MRLVGRAKACESSLAPSNGLSTEADTMNKLVSPAKERHRKCIQNEFNRPIRRSREIRYLFRSDLTDEQKMRTFFILPPLVEATTAIKPAFLASP